jgi:hypothetical protein
MGYRKRLAACRPKAAVEDPRCTIVDSVCLLDNVDGSHAALKIMFNRSLTFAARTSHRDGSRAGESTMSATINWDDLPRFEQRLVIKLFGGGTTRNAIPAVVDGLRSRGLLDENGKLAILGLLVFTLALHKQQSDALLRTGRVA